MSDPPLLRFSLRDDKQVLIEADIRCPDLAALKLPVEPALKHPFEDSQRREHAGRSLQIPLRVLSVGQPDLVTPVLQVGQHVVTRHLLDAAGLEVDEGQGGAVTLIQRFSSAANLNIHLHYLVLDGVYRCGADGVPTFGEIGTPCDDALHALLQIVITHS